MIEENTLNLLHLTNYTETEDCFHMSGNYLNLCQSKVSSLLLYIQGSLDTVCKLRFEQEQSS